jgi:hypothetical protein
MRRIGEFVTEFALDIANESKPPEYTQAGNEKFAAAAPKRKARGRTSAASRTWK